MLGNISSFSSWRFLGWKDLSWALEYYLTQAYRLAHVIAAKRKWCTLRHRCCRYTPFPGCQRPGRAPRKPCPNSTACAGLNPNDLDRAAWPFAEWNRTRKANDEIKDIPADKGIR